MYLPSGGTVTTNNQPFQYRIVTKTYIDSNFNCFVPNGSAVLDAERAFTVHTQKIQKPRVKFLSPLVIEHNVSAGWRDSGSGMGRRHISSISRPPTLLFERMHIMLPMILYFEGDRMVRFHSIAASRSGLSLKVRAKILGWSWNWSFK